MFMFKLALPLDMSNEHLSDFSRYGFSVTRILKGKKEHNFQNNVSK